MCCVAYERSDAGCSQARHSLGTDPHSIKVVAHYTGVVREYAISVISAFFFFFFEARLLKAGSVYFSASSQNTCDDVFGPSYRMISIRPPIPSL